MSAHWKAWTGTLSQGDGVTNTYDPTYFRLLAGGGVELKAAYSTDVLTWRTGMIEAASSPLQFGFIEARMKLPACQGIDSSFFLFGDTTREEIDFELCNKDAQHILLSIHDAGNVHYDSIIYDAGVDLSLDFHTYGFEWTPSYVRWYIDRKYAWESIGYLPQSPMTPFFGMAAGGAAGVPDETSPNPSYETVDWIKVWQR